MVKIPKDQDQGKFDFSCHNPFNITLNYKKNNLIGNKMHAIKYLKTLHLFHT